MSKMLKRLRLKISKLQKNISHRLLDQQLKDINLCFSRAAALIISESLVIRLLARIREVERNVKIQFNKIEYLVILDHVYGSLHNEIEWMNSLLNQSNMSPKFMRKTFTIFSNFKQFFSRLFDPQGLMVQQENIVDKSFFPNKCKFVLTLVVLTQV